MDRDAIFDVLNAAAGRPDCGPVRDVLPVLADALAVSLQPAKRDSDSVSVEQRVVKAAETR